MLVLTLVYTCQFENSMVVWSNMTRMNEARWAQPSTSDKQVTRGSQLQILKHFTGVFMFLATFYFYFWHFQNRFIILVFNAFAFLHAAHTTSQEWFQPVRSYRQTQLDETTKKEVLSAHYFYTLSIFYSLYCLTFTWVKRMNQYFYLMCGLLLELDLSFARISTSQRLFFFLFNS